MPILKELAQQPIAFLGGFASGLLRLDLSEDPVKSWINHQSGNHQSGNTVSKPANTPPESKGPQSISID